MFNSESFKDLQAAIVDVLKEDIGMNLDQIKKAVDDGKTVNWKNAGYVVKKDRKTGKYYVMFLHNKSMVGLTDEDGKLEGNASDFYVS